MLLNEYMIRWKPPRDLHDGNMQDGNGEEDDEREPSDGEGEGGS